MKKATEHAMKDPKLKVYGDFLQQPSEIPTGEHWAIITGSSVWIPGDERSRQAPGHGYPEHTEHHLSYECFMDIEEFKHEVQRLTNAGEKHWRAVHVLPVVVNVQVEVKA